MAASSLNTVYANAMKHHPYGYAMYEPESSSILKPGACGYLTASGVWTPLFYLNDADSLARRGFTPFDGFKPAPLSRREWGPKTSSHVTSRALGVNARAS
jgi:hypothetical protein